MGSVIDEDATDLAAFVDVVIDDTATGSRRTVRFVPREDWEITIGDDGELIVLEGLAIAPWTLTLMARDDIFHAYFSCRKSWPPDVGPDIEVPRILHSAEVAVLGRYRLSLHYEGRVGRHYGWTS